MAFAIVGYRPPTSDEVEGYRIANNVPSSASEATMVDGSVVFYNPTTVEQSHPEFVLLTPAARQQLLSTNPGGVYIHVPLQPIVGDTSSPSSPATPAVTTTPITSGNIDLSQYIQLSTQILSRSYVKNSMTALSGDSILFRNTSSQFSIDIVIQNIGGVNFSPTTFTLSPQGSATVSVTFDTTQINNLSEGVSTLTSVINLSSVVSVAAPQVIPPVITQPATPIIPPIIIEPVFPPLPSGPIHVEPTGPTIPIPPLPTEPRVLPPDGGTPFIPVAPPVLVFKGWTNGLTGEVSQGDPPSGWVYDRASDAWYPPTVVSPQPPFNSGGGGSTPPQLDDNGNPIDNQFAI